MGENQSRTKRRYLVGRWVPGAQSSGMLEADCLLTLPLGPTHRVTSSRKLTLPTPAGFRHRLSIIPSLGL